MHPPLFWLPDRQASHTTYSFNAACQLMTTATLAAVRRAIELDESVAEAHATLGVILALYDWD